MIEKFCSRLPREISNPMYNEHYSRLKEIDFILNNRESYFALKADRQFIELLLALSIFYKRVLTNLDSATKFANTVFKNSEAEAIRIGKYDLTGRERDRIIAIIFNFNSILKKYEIPHELLVFTETRVFIRNIKKLKVRLNSNENMT
jgi:hypothetical protein